MGSRNIDINQEPQPDDCDETGNEEVPDQEKVPEQITTPMCAEVDDKDILPFRASKRLQAAMYRRIQEARGKLKVTQSPVIKERTSSRRPLRSPKVKCKTLSQLGISACRNGDKKASHIVDKRKAAGREASPKDDGSTSMRQRKTSTIRHFQHTEEVEEAARILLWMSNNCFGLRDWSADGLAQGKPAGERPPIDEDVTRQQQSTQPTSHSESLCNHTGPRGRKCFRSRLEGESFCGIHEVHKTS